MDFLFTKMEPAKSKISLSPFKQQENTGILIISPMEIMQGTFQYFFLMMEMLVCTFSRIKFKINQVLGKTVVIHENPDDYRSQPSGAAGKRLACGMIEVL